MVTGQSNILLKQSGYTYNTRYYNIIIAHLYHVNNTSAGKISEGNEQHDWQFLSTNISQMAQGTKCLHAIYNHDSHI